MKLKLKAVPGSIVAPQGFSAAGVFCDIKRLGTGKGSNKGQKRDLALIVSDVPASVAGMFTTNQICAAPVKVCAARLRGGVGRVVVVNSGNANACTGRQGLRDAESMAKSAGEVLGIPAKQVFVGSTGRIGVLMPMDRVESGIQQASQRLGRSPEFGDHAAEAIMTSDTRPKQVSYEFLLQGKKVRIGGICKGAGMIQPGMSATGSRPAAQPAGLHATMLCFLTTDAAVERKTLQQCLQEAVAQSFNRITVDGDMSTNDTVLVLANGRAGNRLIQSKGARDREGVRAFQAALNQVCLELAHMIVRDGEGVTRFVTVRVEGAKNFNDADAAARAVANSALVKTSWHGGDPNWGRIIDALGYSAAKIIEEKVDIGYRLPQQRSVVWSLKRGQPTSASFAQLCRLVAHREFELVIRLHQGDGHAIMYAADLTEEYVDFNKGDVSDPKSLGG